jgi:hypothetical protein
MCLTKGNGVTGRAKSAFAAKHGCPESGRHMQLQQLLARGTHAAEV